MVTCFAWLAHRLVSSKRPTKYVSTASYSALRAEAWNWKNMWPCCWPNSYLSFWKESWYFRWSEIFWYLWTSLKAKSQDCTHSSWTLRCCHHCHEMLFADVHPYCFITPRLLLWNIGSCPWTDCHAHCNSLHWKGNCSSQYSRALWLRGSHWGVMSIPDRPGWGSPAFFITGLQVVHLWAMVTEQGRQSCL